MKAHITGGNGSLPTSNLGKKSPKNEQTAQPLLGQGLPADSFKPVSSEPVPVLPQNSEPVQKEKSLQEQEPPLPLTPEMRVDSQAVTASAPLLLTDDMMVTGPKLSSASQSGRGSLTVLDDAVKQDDQQGQTLAEAARAATSSIGRGITRFILGDQLAPFRAEAAKINEFEAEAKKLKTPEDFALKTKEFRDRLDNGEPLSKLRPEAYAVAREAARQATGMRAYDCQVLGALAMDDSHIAEMRTGEGKTLTAIMPLYLNALAGKGAHLITVNEALAKRDSEWMGPVFDRLGMSVGCVIEDMPNDEKRANYNCDVTYVSDRALGFDFLRDQQVYDPAERVQRGHFFTLIDEVDEVLIDEARTPMIMSGKAGAASSDYQLFGKIVQDLNPDTDFKINEEKRTTWLTDDGLLYVENEVVFHESQATMKSAEPGSEAAAQAKKDRDFAISMRAALRAESQARLKTEEIEEKKPGILSRMVGRNGEYDSEQAEIAEKSLEKATKAREELAKKGKVLNLYALENNHRVSYMMASLKAHTLFEKGKGYTVEAGEVKIVDSNKGRVSDGKRFSQGLHQALEVKEGLEPRAETRTISKITMPELIGLYERKAGMTGTAKTSEGEFIETYGLDVLEIPTNKPVIRTDHADVVFATKEAKYQKVVEEAMEAAKAGRPVLVGTVSVIANQNLAARFLNAGWPHDKIQILNAETVKGGEDCHDENAGRSGSITLTTGDRSKLVKHDSVNYKKLAFAAMETVQQQRKPMVIDVQTPKDAEHVQAWLSVGDVHAPVTKNGEIDPEQVIQIRVGQSKDKAKLPDGFIHMDSKPFQVDEPKLYKVTEDNLEEVVEKALEAMQEGEPVILESPTTKQMGESARSLLDYGLGLDALPMVCEGKEKENVMIEIAVRSGIITLATNMAGRGANIKPDLVATDHIAEAAYAKVEAGEPVTISVKKKSQATKIKKFLDGVVPLAFSDDPNRKAKPGEVLIRYGKELPDVTTGAHFTGEDFDTGGLLVIGTERASSKRVDDQLIGRAGRQGAPGDSIFYVSLEDDINRIHGGEKLEPLIHLFGDSQTGTRNKLISGVLSNAQESVENMHIEQRTNASKYRDTHKVQREAWFGMRKSVLLGEEEITEFTSNFAAQGLAETILSKIGDDRKVSTTDVQAAIREFAAETIAAQVAEGHHDEAQSEALTEQLAQAIQLPEAIMKKEKIRSEDLGSIIYPQVESLFDQPRLDKSTLREHVLRNMDIAWIEHLAAMDEIKQGIHLVGYAQLKPELEYPARAAEQFENTFSYYKRELASRLVPAAARISKNAPATSN